MRNPMKWLRGMLSMAIIAILVSGVMFILQNRPAQIATSQENSLLQTDIPSSFNGSAVVTSDIPLAVIANSFKSGTGDTIGSYPANHR